MEHPTDNAVAVTAASGRLGREILQSLLARCRSEQVVAVARDPSRVQVAGIDKRRGDYESSEQMQAALTGIDTVVMISAPVAGGSDRLALHRNVIAAAKAAGVRKLIYTSVIGAELATQTMFAPFYAINRQTEADLQASGMEWIAARNGLYLDLDLVHIRHANEHGGVYRNNGGEGRCGYISIAELGFALAALACSNACNGQVVNLIGDTYTQAELVQFANEAYGLSVRYESISAQQNFARFMADERIAARGEDVAKMLTGCFEAIAIGAFDVPSDFVKAAGRMPLSIPEQMAAIARG